MNNHRTMIKSIRNNNSSRKSKRISVVPEINNTDNEMWSQFEKFKKWYEDQKQQESSLGSSSVPDDEMPIILEETSTNVPITESKTRRTLKARRAPQTQNIQTQTSNQNNNSSNIVDQTLNQPLNPNVFLRGALKGFPKCRYPVANTKNARRYPQVADESLNKLASTFMAAPTPEILALMAHDTFSEDFHIENCKSSSEYLYCLMGFGLHQTLNFPIMGVFYLELARLILKHMNKFSSNEKVKLIQIRLVCEDILKQNSIRDDFLPVEIMETIVDKVVREKYNKIVREKYNKVVREQDNKHKSVETLSIVRTNKRKRSDTLDTEVLLVDEDEDEQSGLDLSSVKEGISHKRKSRGTSSPIGQTVKLIDLDAVEESPVDQTSPKPSSDLETSRQFTSPFKIPNDLASLLGIEKGTQMSSQEVVKKLWVYIKRKKLQDPKNGQYIKPDKAMEPIFGKEKMGAYAMVTTINKLQSQHQLKESLTKRLQRKGVSVSIGSKTMNIDNEKSSEISDKCIDLGSDSESEIANIFDIPENTSDNISTNDLMVSSEKKNEVSTDDLLVLPKNNHISTDDLLVSPEKNHTSTDDLMVSSEKKNEVSIDDLLVSPKNNHISTDDLLVSPEKNHISTDNLVVSPKKKHTSTDDLMVSTEKSNDNPKDLSDLCDYIRKVKKEILSPTKLDITEKIADNALNKRVQTPRKRNPVSEDKLKKVPPPSKSKKELSPKKKKKVQSPQKNERASTNQKNNKVLSPRVQTNSPNMLNHITNLLHESDDEHTSESKSMGASSILKNTVSPSRVYKSQKYKELNALTNLQESDSKHIDEDHNMKGSYSLRNEVLPSQVISKDSKLKVNNTNKKVFSPRKHKVSSPGVESHQKNKMDNTLVNLVQESDDKYMSEDKNKVSATRVHSSQKNKVLPPRVQCKSSKIEDDDISILQEVREKSDDNSERIIEVMEKDEIPCNDCFSYFNTEDDLKKHDCIGKAKQDKQAPSKSSTDIQFEQSKLNFQDDSDSDEEEGLSTTFNWDNI